MLRVRIVVLAFVITLVGAGCSSSSGQAAAYEKHLRPFVALDGPLLDAEPDRAVSIEAYGHTKIATSDIRLTPVCNGRHTFIVVGKQVGLGRWLGGDPGCQVVEMTLSGSYHEITFNPFCQLDPVYINGNCLKLLKHRTTSADMMSHLRPATAEEVAKLVNPDPEYDPRQLPSELELKRFLVVKPDQGPLTMAPLFNSNAITIIVPQGVKLNGGQIGHNQLYIGGKGKYGDPLCQAVKQHGIAALPIEFSGSELAYAQACQTQDQ